MEKLIVYGTILSLLAIVLPLFLSFDLFADIKADKIFISPRLFGVIPLVGGYLTVQKEGLYFHFSEKKAACFLFSGMKDDKNSKVIAKAFFPISVKSTIEIGSQTNPIGMLVFGSLLQALFAVIYSIFAEKKPYLKLKNGVIISKEKSCAMATLHIVTVFSLLTLTIAFIKIIWEGIIELWQTKKTKQLKT